MQAIEEAEPVDMQAIEEPNNVCAVDPNPIQEPEAGVRGENLFLDNNY